MKRGRLTLEEKYIIQGMLNDGKNVTNISNKINRSKKMVEKYIDNELNQLHETIVNVEKSNIDNKITVSKEIYTETLHKLKKDISNSENINPDKLLDETIASLEHDPDSSAQLLSYCIQNLKANQFMANRTSSGKKGISVMTGTASARGDEHKNKIANRQISRSAKGHVYRPFDGDIV